MQLEMAVSVFRILLLSSWHVCVSYTFTPKLLSLFFLVPSERVLRGIKFGQVLEEQAAEQRKEAQLMPLLGERLERV